MAYMLFIKDEPGQEAARAALRAAHVAYVTSHLDKMIFGGGILKETGEPDAMGGLMVLDVETRAEAEAFVAGDPFTLAGVPQVVQIEKLRVPFLKYGRFEPPQDR